MKILLTGGAGFIGSHVADVYIRAGHRVAVLDDLSSGSHKNLNPRAKFYKGDIRDPKLVRLILKKERPEAKRNSFSHPRAARSTAVLENCLLPKKPPRTRSRPTAFPSSWRRNACASSRNRADSRTSSCAMPTFSVPARTLPARREG